MQGTSTTAAMSLSMKMVTRCDRCSAELSQGEVATKIAIGARATRYDLCARCTEALRQFITRAREANE